MDYTKHYNLLIEKAKNRDKLNGYKENHHIIPTCIGGTDDKLNRVDLTAREHFIAHILLVKIYPTEYGLIKAVNMMCIGSKMNNNKRNTNRMYGWLREKFSEAMSKQMSVAQKGEKNSQFGTMWIHNLELKESKKIKKDELLNWISKGWLKGRIINFDKKPYIRKPKKPTIKTKRVWVSNFEIKHSVCISETDLSSYIDKGYVRKRVFNFDKPKKRGKTKEMLKNEYKLKAEKSFKLFIDGDYNSLSDFVRNKFEKHDISKIRYSWITHIKGFKEFLNNYKSGIGITSVILRDKIKMDN